MSTTTRPARFSVSTPLAVAVRAIVAAGLAIVVTFGLDHSDPAGFGLCTP